MLELTNISLTLGGCRILTDCSLTVAAGEIVALAGPNGAGKTSLLSVASGHLHPDSGSVTLDGQTVTACSPEKLAARGLGRCFQGSRVFELLTVGEHLALAHCHALSAGPLAIPAKTSPDITAVLELTGLAGMEARRGSELSFGQRKLLDLARAMSRRPRLLLLDEPVAGVSPARRRIIEGALCAFRELGGAILLVEHELATVRELADKLVFMADGRIVVSGPPAAVLADEQVRTLYLGLGGAA